MKADTKKIDFASNFDIDDIDLIDTEQPVCWALDEFSDVVPLDGAATHYALPDRSVGDGS